MICLDNTDTLEGGASVDNVVDYTVHGLVGTTFTNIAQGQLSVTNPTVLYTAGAAISIVSVIYVNTHSAAVTVDLYLDPANAGTPRRLIPKALTLGVGYSAHFDGARLSILDAVGGLVTGVNISDTAFGASWDGVTTIAPSKNVVWDALGTGASPTFTGETLSGLTASLPLFTGASKELVSKSVADTQTALGIKTDAIVGDATAGRVLRAIYITIMNGTNASTIKPSSTAIWNGDGNAEENNLGKSGDTGVFALDAGGNTLTLKNGGISGDAIAVLSTSIRYNYCGTVLTVYAQKIAAGISLGVANAATGADLDFTVLVDTGTIEIYITYLTSA